MKLCHVKQHRVFGVLTLVISFLLSSQAYSVSTESKKSCRGKVENYGHFAFALHPGFMGKVVLRNCGLVGEIAQHFGYEPVNYDTYVMDGFGTLECSAANESAPERPTNISCDLNNSLLAESLDDDIGIQFRQVMSYGSISFQDRGEGEWEFNYLIESPRFSTYRKKIVVTDISCSEEEIRPEEGTCE
jgi:hypothetical protein